MPEPIIDPTTSAVELKSPSDCTNCGLEEEEDVEGAGCFSEAVGIVTWIGFSRFGRKSLLLSFALLSQHSHPAPELRRWISRPEDRRRHGHAIRPSRQNVGRRLQRD